MHPSTALGPNLLKSIPKPNIYSLPRCLILAAQHRDGRPKRDWEACNQPASPGTAQATGICGDLNSPSACTEEGGTHWGS